MRHIQGHKKLTSKSTKKIINQKKGNIVTQILSQVNLKTRCLTRYKEENFNKGQYNFIFMCM